MRQLSPGLQRVFALDTDQLILEGSDHLFLRLPKVDVAGPRAYWLAKDYSTITFMSVSLPERLWETLKNVLGTLAYGKFDLNVIDELLSDTVTMWLLKKPHQQFRPFGNRKRHADVSRSSSPLRATCVTGVLR